MFDFFANISHITLSGYSQQFAFKCYCFVYYHTFRNIDVISRNSSMCTMGHNKEVEGNG